MSDEEFDGEDDGEKSPAWYRKQIREANERAANAEAEAATNREAARRVAFQDAKIPDTPQTKFFREHYDGEWSAEAIRGAALEYGFADSTDAASAHSAQAVDAMSQAAAGGESQVNGDQDAYERELEEAANNAMPGFESAEIAKVVARYRQPVI